MFFNSVIADTATAQTPSCKRVQARSSYQQPNAYTGPTYLNGGISGNPADSFFGPRRDGLHGQSWWRHGDGGASFTMDNAGAKVSAALRWDSMAAGWLR